MLKAAADPVVPKLHDLCRRIWTEERVPPEWKEGVILSFYKNKGDRRSPSSYRPITLLSVPSKVVTLVLLRRILPLLHRKRRPQQAGFTPGRSTTDCILALTVLAQQRREYRQPLYAAYVDLKAAFDSLDREALWLLLQGIGVPPKYINIIRDMYTGTTCRIRAEGAESDPFPTTSGVRQGCVAAPNLFNVAVDYWVDGTTSRCPDLGVDFHHHFSDLCYADDAAFLAMLLDTLSDALVVLDEEASPLGLAISWAKTKIQSLSSFLPPPPASISVGQEQVETVTEFVYLGSKISTDCSSDPEIERRLQLARGTFGRLSRVWRSCRLSLRSKLRLLNTCVLPVLLYGSETWTLSANLSRRLDAFHRSCLRFILGVRWFHRVSNDELYRRVRDPTTISTRVRRGRLRLLGHVARLGEDVPANQVLQAASRPPPRAGAAPRVARVLHGCPRSRRPAPWHTCSALPKTDSSTGSWCPRSPNGVQDQQSKYFWQNLVVFRRFFYRIHCEFYP